MAYCNFRRMIAEKLDEFLWGAATSAHQVEGNCRDNDWWAWEQSGHIEGGARSGLATDHWNRYKEDLALAKSLKLNAYRFSIEWSKLVPQEGAWNTEALQFYIDLVDECLRLGLRPMATLHHFSSPKWFCDLGGFASESSPHRFMEFVDQVLSSPLGNKIDLWCTINEPMPLVVGSYLASFMPPGGFLPKRAKYACTNLLRAHVAAYDLIHAKCKPISGRKPMVGFAHNMIHFRAERKYHPIERWLVAKVDKLYNMAWLDAVTGGKQKFAFPFILPKAPIVESALDRTTVDFIGVNYYTKAYIEFGPRDKKKDGASEVPIGITFARRKEVASDLGWAIHPEGFRKMLRRAASYGLPIFVTENGIADRTDRLRSRFLTDHLLVLAQEMERGMAVLGYFHWSLLDNFEWIKGFWPRFGLFSVNYETFERKMNPSASIYREIIEGSQKFYSSSEVTAQHRGGMPRSQVIESVSAMHSKS